VTCWHTASYFAISFAELPPSTENLKVGAVWYLDTKTPPEILKSIKSTSNQQIKGATIVQRCEVACPGL
jgi:hypothetical protein